MASTTPNIGLTLPTGAEKVGRQIINTNNTIIDSKIGAVPVGQNLQGEVDALNGKLNYSVEITNDTTTTINAGESKEIAINVSKANKKAISITGVIPYYPNVMELQSFTFGLNTQTATIRIKNTGSSSYAGVTVVCLYVPT